MASLFTYRTRIVSFLATVRVPILEKEARYVR